MSVCDDMPVKHGFILYRQIFDFIIHVDVSDSVIVLAQPGCSNGCLLFFPPDFLFSFYLNVTASWSAKTNLCPLRDFCERCIQCFVNAVFLHSSTFVIQTTDHCLSCSTTATNGVPLSQRGVNVELDSSQLTVPDLSGNQRKTAFHKINLHSLDGNQEYRTSKRNLNVLFCVLAPFSVTVTKMDVCISVIIYEYSI